jgi:hypothetical protein
MGLEQIGVICLLYVIIRIAKPSSNNILGGVYFRSTVIGTQDVGSVIEGDQTILQFPLPSICIPIYRLCKPIYKEVNERVWEWGLLNKKVTMSRSFNFLKVFSLIYTF